MKSFKLIISKKALKANSVNLDKDSYNFLGRIQGHHVMVTKEKSLILLSQSEIMPTIRAFNKEFNLKMYKISNKNFFEKDKNQYIITPIYRLPTFIDFNAMYAYRKENSGMFEIVDEFLISNRVRIKEILSEISETEKVLFLDENTFSFNEINEVITIDEDDDLLD